jgi:pimeloyl-ACP methyl ester carboxylesterase
MLTEKMFDTGGVFIEYGEGPDNGPPLVFLTGTPNRYQSYCLGLIHTLSQRWHVYAINYRGTGKSSRVNGKYRLIDHTNDVIQFVKHLDEAPVLVGHSYGAVLSITVAARIGEQVRGLVLGDPPISNESLAAWMDSDMFQGFFDLLISIKDNEMPPFEVAKMLGGGVVTPSSYEKVKTYGYHDREFYMTLRNSKKHLEGSDIRADVAKIKCPTLLIQADNVGMGQALSNDEVEYAKSVIPELVHVHTKGISHDLGINIWEVPPTLMSDIMRFLEYLRP